MGHFTFGELPRDPGPILTRLGRQPIQFLHPKPHTVFGVQFQQLLPPRKLELQHIGVNTIGFVKILNGCEVLVVDSSCQTVAKFYDSI